MIFTARSNAAPGRRGILLARKISAAAEPNRFFPKESHGHAEEDRLRHEEDRLHQEEDRLRWERRRCPLERTWHDSDAVSEIDLAISKAVDSIVGAIFSTSLAFQRGLINLFLTGRRGTQSCAP